ncbi:hypothetical protein FPOAC2_05031 [Fusarium poae]|jgi:hypothetical protein|uniref:hypothetical protein n=1 Tax=Fusarium poae TaxID=36050 RepID=UPI001CE769A6|nr:hypothetical protein FPOAC1_004931 [Fusarium poae]KAG8671677.1 hypothetical protein FPOAC1_004931 [Fusarium poae]
MATPGLNEAPVNLTHSPVPDDVTETDKLLARSEASALSLEKQYRGIKEQSRVLKEIHHKLTKNNRGLKESNRSLMEINGRLIIISRKLLKNNRRLMERNHKLREENACLRRTLRRFKNATCATLPRERQEYEVRKVIRMHLMMDKLSKSFCKNHYQL